LSGYEIFNWSIRPIILSLNTQAQNEEAIMKAIEKGKWEKILDLTFPEMIKKIGGQRRALKQAQLSDQQMEQQGFKVKVVELSKPLKEVKSNSHLMSIVPMRITFEGPLGKLYSESSLLSISKDKGETWTYISMAQVDFEDILELFPNISSELEFPKSRIYQDN
jgi:hypothetical protein